MLCLFLRLQCGAPDHVDAPQVAKSFTAKQRLLIGLITGIVFWITKANLERCVRRPLVPY